MIDWIIGGSAALNVILLALWQTERLARSHWELLAIDACEGERLAQAEVLASVVARIRREARS